VAKVNRLAEVKQGLQQQRRERRNECRVRIDRAEALRKEMQLKTELGQLLHADGVRARAFQIGRQVRDAILNIPNRLSTIIAAETDVGTIRSLLVREVQ